MQQVSASAAQKDVIGAIVSSAGQTKTRTDPNRYLGIAFIFILVFAGAVYFSKKAVTFWSCMAWFSMTGSYVLMPCLFLTTRGGALHNVSR